jgi:DNA-binding winged helix-turn-helix (wHTH) protein/TolB-like protein/Tfp pilus assembly protein PilF
VNRSEPRAEEDGSVDSANGAARLLAVGDFRLDLMRRRLLDSQNQTVELSARLFDALVYFAEHRGELLDKDRLMAALWPGLVVEENNLNKVVSALRRALGDDGEDKRYLLTVPRRGFRFVADVRKVTASAWPPLEPAAAAAPPAAQADVQVSAPEQPRRRRALITGGAAAAAVAVGATGLWAWRRAADEAASAPRAAAAATTLAVLPFRPLPGGLGDQVLELGMADSLIARLSTARGVVVRPIGAVRRYTAADTDPLRAARELGVGWVLEGSVQQKGQRAHVTARLLEVSSGAAAWSGNFDETFTHVFDVQETISRRVAEVVIPQLAERDRGQMAGAGTGNTDAYRLYLEARYQTLLYTPDAFRRAIVLYRQAIAADPRYVYAHVGLADVLRRTVFTSNTAPRDTFEAVGTAAQRAIELDPQLGDGHAMLGLVAYWYEWDWPRAEQTMRRARELNPSSVDAHYGLAHVLMTTGRPAEALPLFTRAREIDPHSPPVNCFEGGMLAMSGHVGEGIARIEHAIGIDPVFWISRLFLGNVLINSGQTDAGLVAMQRAVELSRGSAWAGGMLGHALAQAGRTKQAQGVLLELLARGRSGFISPAMIAAVQLALGETEAAMAALEQAYDVRDTRLVFLQAEHRWAPLRGSARFAALARRLGLDAAPPKTALAF